MFSKFELTNKGVELLNRVIAEQKTLKFTKFQIGKGDFSGDKKTLTQLASKIDEFDVSQTNVLADGITNIKGFYDNRNLSVASKLTEIGIMARLGDDSLTEVLFSYSNQPSAEAETIPSKESYFSRTFSVMNRTDNVTSVTFDLTIRQDKYNFGTLAEMKAADYLDVGDKVTLWGNSALGDSSFKMYIITDQTQLIQLNNKLYAKEYFKIVNNLTEGGTNNAFSAEQGKQLENKKLNKTDIVNDLTTGGADNALSGQMGVELNDNKIGARRDFPDFDGTYGDFKTKVKPGIYRLYNSAGIVDKLGINLYNTELYSSGTLIVRFSPGNLDMEFIPDNLRNYTYRFNEYDFTIKSDSTKFIDSVQANETPWKRVILEDSPIFLGLVGATSFKYIQTVGQKTKGQIYLDRDTGKFYVAKQKNNDITVTDNFKVLNILENSNTISDVLVLFDQPDLALMRAEPDGYGQQTVSFTLNKEYEYLNIYGTAVGYIKIPTNIFDTNFVDRWLTYDNGTYDFYIKITNSDNNVTIKNFGNPDGGKALQTLNIYKITQSHI